MTNKTKMIGTSVVALLLLGIGGGAFAYNQVCATPEAQMIRKAVQTYPAIQAKFAGLPALEKIEAKICTLKKLTPEEIAKIVAKKQADSGFTPPPDAKSLPPMTLGVQAAIDPTVFGRSLILGTNTWKGYVDGTLTTGTGTAEAKNPSQGVLFMWEPGTNTSNIESSRTYTAPTATGPLKIISEANGVLTLQSVAGIYQAYNANTNTRHNVTAKGGTAYKFDLRTRTFR